MGNHWCGVFKSNTCVFWNDNDDQIVCSAVTERFKSCDVCGSVLINFTLSFNA